MGARAAVIGIVGMVMAALGVSPARAQGTEGVARETADGLEWPAPSELWDEEEPAANEEEEEELVEPWGRLDVGLGALYGSSSASERGADGPGGVGFLGWALVRRIGGGPGVVLRGGMFEDSDAISATDDPFSLSGHFLEAAYRHGFEDRGEGGTALIAGLELGVGWSSVEGSCTDVVHSGFFGSDVVESCTESERRRAQIRRGGWGSVAGVSIGLEFGRSAARGRFDFSFSHRLRLTGGGDPDHMIVFAITAGLSLGR